MSSVDGVSQSLSFRSSSVANGGIGAGTGNAKTFSGKGGKQATILEHSAGDAADEEFGVSGRVKSKDDGLFPQSKKGVSAHSPVDGSAQAHHTASAVVGASTSTESAISNPLTGAVQSESNPTVPLDAEE